MKRLKKILSLALAILIIVTMLPLNSVFASEYETWKVMLTTDNQHHEWTIKFNMLLDKDSVTSSSAYILNDKGIKLNFINPDVSRKGKGLDCILLRHNGLFEIGKIYTIVIEDTVKSLDGISLKKGIKAKFIVEAEEIPMGATVTHISEGGGSLYGKYKLANVFGIPDATEYEILYKDASNQQKTTGLWLIGEETSENEFRNATVDVNIYKNNGTEFLVKLKNVAVEAKEGKMTATVTHISEGDSSLYGKYKVTNVVGIPDGTHYQILYKDASNQPKTTAHWSIGKETSGNLFRNATVDVKISKNNGTELLGTLKNIKVEFILPDPAADFAGGTGTKNDPYLVATAQQLDNVRRYLDKHFKQTAYINLFEPWDKGKGWKPIGDISNIFVGSYDGNNKEITGLKINRSEEDYQGLFGYVGNAAELKNIRLMDVQIYGKDYVGAMVGNNNGNVMNCYAYFGSINGYSKVGGLIGNNYWNKIEKSFSTASVKGNNQVGGLVGNTELWSYIENSYATGSVEGIYKVGGLVGYNKGSIYSCYAQGSTIGKESVGGLVGHNQGSRGEGGRINKSYATGLVKSSFSDVGGLVGQNVGGAVQDCYATGEVDGYDFAGGLVGWNDYTITNCYSVGKVKASNKNSHVGGLVSWTKDGVVQKSYYNKETSGQKDNDGRGVPKSTKDMTSNIYSGWNFVNIWEQDSQRSYPYLRWQGIINIPIP